MRYLFIIKDNKIISATEYTADLPRIYTTQTQEIKTVDEMLKQSLDTGIDFSLLIDKNLIDLNILNSIYTIEFDDDTFVNILNISINFSDKNILLTLLYNNTEKSIHYYNINNDKLIDDIGEFDYYYNAIITNNFSFRDVISASINELKNSNKFN